MPKRRFVGKVISTKRRKTITVLVEKWAFHKKLKKRFKVKKKYHVHDENEIAKVGDKVLIEESRPISKTKKWKLVEVLKK